MSPAPMPAPSAMRSRFSSALAAGQALSVTLGDQSVFEAVVAACGLPAGWQKRLIHAFGNSDQIDALLDAAFEPAAGDGPEPRDRGAAASGDEATLIAHIDETMQATGYSTNASR